MHRVAQVVAHVRARVDADEEAFARRLLPPRAWSLFTAMPVADRRHALDVAGKLVAAGHDAPELLAAALLHDVAKGGRMRLWHRIGGVLLGAAAPRLLHRLADPDPLSWRHPFYLYLHHGPMSADLVERAGGAPTTVRLIRGTPNGEAETAQLRALQAADDAS